MGEITLSDIAALLGNRNNGGFGGDDGALRLIIILVLFGGWGNRGGWGSGANVGGYGSSGTMGHTDPTEIIRNMLASLSPEMRDQLVKEFV